MEHPAHRWSYGCSEIFRKYAALMAGVWMMVAVASAADAQWTKIDAPQMANIFIGSIDFESSLVGYAVGSTPNASQMYKTTDGGHTWEELGGIGVSLYTFTFLDENTGLVGGRSKECECMMISRTTDGGKNWKLDSIRSADGTLEHGPESLGIYSFSFIDNETGFASGASGTLLKTTDRGATWARMDIGSTTDIVSSVSYAAPEKIYAIAAAPSDIFLPNIFYRSTNSGAGWQNLPGFIEYSGFSSIRFITPDIGFVCGSGNDAVIYKTTDGGETWTKKYSAGNSSDAFFKMAFENQNIGYAVGTRGVIRTTDGGETWAPETLGTNAIFEGISISDGNVYVSGSSGTILQRATTPAGVDVAQHAATAGMMMPNPVITTATVSHPGLARQGAYLAICDLLGREVRRIPAVPGSGTLQFSREGLAPGTYIYRAMAGADVLATGTVVIR